MADTPEQFAAKTFKKQGLDPHAAGLPPTADRNVWYGPQVKDASGDTLKGGGPSTSEEHDATDVIQDMMNKSAAQARAAANDRSQIGPRYKPAVPK
jgi:hypothetical protein